MVGLRVYSNTGILAYTYTWSKKMSKTMTVRVSGALSDFVASNVGEHGRYENTSEYMRDLIRQDMKRQDDERLELLRTELERAFAASDDTYKALNAETFLARHRGER